MTFDLIQLTELEKGALFMYMNVYKDGSFKKSYDTSSLFSSVDQTVFSSRKKQNLIVIPGLVDLHVHLRQPGFSYKETIASGTRAASGAGYTTVCAMPNLKPPPDSPQGIAEELDMIERDAVINVIPYSRITKSSGELVNFEEMRKFTYIFSDDGRGVQDEDVMRSAMLACCKVNGIIAAHCEDESLVNGGYIHDGAYAAIHSHIGISSASEYKQLERDLRLVGQTGCRYHVCHVSTKESVELLRDAKKKGLPVTAETAPHYLLLCDDDICEDGRFKMNPPLRSALDRNALLEAVSDGTIDVIATDHAPHSADEKSRGLKDSLMGIVGLETAFPLLYTYLVKEGIITLEQLIELMCVNPRRIFNIDDDGICVYSLDEQYNIDSNKFISMGRSTPFDNWQVCGKNILTAVKGEIVWQEGK